MKSIDKILGLSDDDYRNYVSNLLHEEDSLWKIDELDDELLKIVEKHSVAVERLCRINSTVFITLDQEDMRNYALAYNFNTLMIAAIYQNNIPLSKSIFIEGITFCRENQQFHAGQSLSNNIFKLFASNQVALDEAPYFLKQITGFFNDLGKYQDAIEAMCAAAFYFADVSSFQSAYRTINDAQEIAITQNLPRSQLKILETQYIH